MSNQQSLREVIDLVSQEKGIDPKLLIEATEQAILTAAKRTFGMNRELEARFNEDTGAVDLFQYMTVVDEIDLEDREITVEDAQRYGLDAEIGEELGFQIFYLASQADLARQQDKEYGDLLGVQQARHGFGRIAAQTAKQVIIQRVREAEREKVWQEFKNRQGELISGTVRRFERGSNIIVDLDRGTEGGRTVEAVLPPREQTPRESYRPGDRIVALLKEIDREARGPQIILSRTDVGLLVKLFEMEVPEIYEGIVRIVAASREPGARSKIAVASRDNDVDPVGACVGMKGSRVQAVVQELRGEKIDIVPFDRDPARFVCNAIAPAEVVRVVIDESNGTMELVVPDPKLSLAIGRRGQNVRLASQLSGWRLDIVSESRFQQMEEESMAAMTRIGGDEELARSLYRMGFRSLDEVADAPLEELLTVEGITEANVDQIKADAATALEAVRQELLSQASSAAELPNDKDRLRLVRGVTERTLEMLERGRYAGLELIAREEDVDKLALKTGLSAGRASVLKENVAAFLADEWPRIVTGVRAQMAKLTAEEEAAAAAAAEAAANEPPAEDATAATEAPGESTDADEPSTDTQDEG